MQSIKHQVAKRLDRSIDVARAVLFLVFAITGVSAVISWDREAVAQCNPYTQSFANNGAAVPCSNTTFCYTPNFSINCTDNGKLIVQYQNSNPPPDWCNCGPGAPGMNCSETAQPCGTTIWYWGPCDPRYTCTAGNIRFCKC